MQPPTITPEEAKARDDFLLVWMEESLAAIKIARRKGWDAGSKEILKHDRKAGEALKRAEEISRGAGKNVPLKPPRAEIK